ncbi:glycoside hydrolase family 16 protein [Promicromonospora sp. NPDC023987]|uniref:glycoside hydrolase family 16 protein n=1 Tax=Promicromonospora sp. NPDC023987 TaxID=3155360 RepID=UPI0033E391C1
MPISNRSRTRLAATILALALATGGAAGLIGGAAPPAAGTPPSPGAPVSEQTEQVLLFDDFDGTSLDTSLWTPGLHQWGSDNNGVVPENVWLDTVSDGAGGRLSALVTRANGDDYDGSVRGIKATDASYPIGDPRRYTRQDTGVRTGGLVWTNERYGAGRYEVRMKALPYSGGCSCVWNYYNPDDGSDYTEIDIEIPAAGTADRSDWRQWVGFNSYIAPTAAGGTSEDVDVNIDNHDGAFHTYRWDWYDGSGGTARIEFYIDDIHFTTQTLTVPTSPAPLWVGNWAAHWSGSFDYDTQYLYVDWVRISTLPAS